MALILDPIPAGEPVDYAERARRVCTKTCKQIEKRLHRIRNIAQAAGGLAALDAELGAPDAADLAAAYAALKAAAVAINPGVVIPDLA